MHPKHACGERGAHLAGRRHGRPLRPRAGPRVRARAGRAAGRPRRRAGHRGAARREGQVARAVRGGHGRGRPHRRAGARVVDRRVVHLRTARPAARERGLGVRARSLRSGGRLCEGALSLHVAEHRLQGPAGPSSLGGCATHTSPGRPHTWCAAQQRPLRGFGTDVTGPAQARRRAQKKKKKKKKKKKTAREDGAHRRARLERAGRRRLLRRRGGRRPRGRRGGLRVILCLQPPRELLISLACRRACAARHHCTLRHALHDLRHALHAGLVHIPALALALPNPLPVSALGHIRGKVATRAPQRPVCLLSSLMRLVQGGFTRMSGRRCRT